MKSTLIILLLSFAAVKAIQEVTKKPDPCAADQLMRGIQFARCVTEAK